MRFWISLFFFLEICLPDKGMSVVGSVSTSIRPTIIIDPGHGGTDQGTKEKKPFCEEKRICLQAARLVKKYLDQLGYHVVMTRETDVFVSLPRRVEIARQANASIFVSLHFNSAPSPVAQGIEIFFYDSKEEKHRSVLSRRLADSVLARLIRRTSAHSRGVKNGNFYVIRETSIPSIIVEGGFISNPTERVNLKSSEYQEKIARGVADGIDYYLRKGKHVERPQILPKAPTEVN